MDRFLLLRLAELPFKTQVDEIVEELIDLAPKFEWETPADSFLGTAVADMDCATPLPKVAKDVKQ